MKANQKNLKTLERLQRVAPNATIEQAAILRRAEMTLHRWDESECGDSNDHCSWCNVRDDDGTTWREVYSHRQPGCQRFRIRDLESGAIRRVEAVCKELGIEFYHQSDCRGVALYVGKNLTDANYNSGVAIQ